MIDRLLGDPLLAAFAAVSAAVIAVGATTVSLSVVNAHRRGRREAAREQIRGELFEELYADEPDWDAWTGDLGRGERGELLDLLDAYLRRLRGEERERLRSLAETLGIHARARRSLAHGEDRLEGLTWLALLGEPIDPERLRRHADTTVLRAAAARVLYESDQPDAPVVGTDLLLGEGQQPLTAFGLDTLYRLNHGGETPLLRAAAERADAWDPRVVEQTLAVLRFCQIVEPGERFAWVVPLLDHDAPRVRLGAMGVVERHGWREGFRERIDIDARFADPHPSVRIGAFAALASWADDEALETLRRHLADAETDRERLLGTRYLAAAAPTVPLPRTPELEPFADWVAAEATAGGLRRLKRGVVVWS